MDVKQMLEELNERYKPDYVGCTPYDVISMCTECIISQAVELRRKSTSVSTAIAEMEYRLETLKNYFDCREQTEKELERITRANYEQFKSLR